MAFCPQEQDGGADGQQDPHHERGGVRDSDHQDVRLGETLRRSHRQRQEVKIPKGFVVCRKQRKQSVDSSFVGAAAFLHFAAGWMFDFLRTFNEPSQFRPGEFLIVAGAGCF